MIFVDSSVWIDYFRGAPSAAADYLDLCLKAQRVITGDLIVTEVLRGFDRDAEFDLALDLMRPVRIVELGGYENAVEAARKYRHLRKLGFTVRSTIDVLIAQTCIREGYTLLHGDRDFRPYTSHLGLKVVELPRLS